jgi:hypothetical protein
MKGPAMKHFILAFALLMIIGVASVQAQTSTTTQQRSRTTITDETVATASPVTASIVPVTTAITTEDTTKGGLPVSGSVETTMMLAVGGLALASFGAYRALKQ